MGNESVWDRVCQKFRNLTDDQWDAVRDRHYLEDYDREYDAKYDAKTVSYLVDSINEDFDYATLLAGGRTSKARTPYGTRGRYKHKPNLRLLRLLVVVEEGVAHGLPGGREGRACLSRVLRDHGQRVAPDSLMRSISRAKREAKMLCAVLCDVEYADAGASAIAAYIHMNRDVYVELNYLRTAKALVCGDVMFDRIRRDLEQLATDDMTEQEKKDRSLAVVKREVLWFVAVINGHSNSELELPHEWVPSVIEVAIATSWLRKRQLLLRIG